MKNKKLLVFAFLIIGFVIIVRIVFNANLNRFLEDIEAHEFKKYELFYSEKEVLLEKFQNEHPNFFSVFSSNLADEDAIIIKDTIYNFLYLSKTINYKEYSLKYLDCLQLKCSIEIKNNLTQRDITNLENRLIREHGDIFQRWYNELKDEILIIKEPIERACSSFFEDIYELNYEPIAWDEFRKFLTYFSQETKTNEIANNRTIRLFENQKSRVQNQLRRNVHEFFNSGLNSNPNKVITTSVEDKTYSSQYLGTINFTIEKLSFNQPEFDLIADAAFKEHWKDNFLAHSSTPYAHLYGSSNTCQGWSCSEIEVTSRNTDLLIIIKDINGRVVRHGYISANRKMTFHVPNGRYQVFFYSGTGWNPNKVMGSVNNRVIKGGFVSNESFKRDIYETLNNTILSYTWTITTTSSYSSIRNISQDEMFQ